MISFLQVIVDHVRTCTRDIIFPFSWCYGSLYFSKQHLDRQNFKIHGQDKKKIFTEHEIDIDMKATRPLNRQLEA
jgi:hypothetical protein